MAHSHALKAVHSDMPGGWEGGSLTALRDVIRQTCTKGRMAVIYTTLAIVGYLSKHSCSISGTENKVKIRPPNSLTCN